MRRTSVGLRALVLGALLLGCGRVRQARDRPDPLVEDLWDPERPRGVGLAHNRRASPASPCPSARPVHVWGPVPRGPAPAPRCPIQVELARDDIVASSFSPFDPLPWFEAVPTDFLVGARRVMRVDDGWLVAYGRPGLGQLSWFSPDGERRRELSAARVVGFARTGGGVVMALAVGRARLGRGGVLALERGREEGSWTMRLVAALPLEPSAVAFDDRGSLVGFAQGFVFRVDDQGIVENLHYFSHDIGAVASIARSTDGAMYVGIECGVIRLVPNGFGYQEEFWSARTGASGAWSAC